MVQCQDVIQNLFYFPGLQFRHLRILRFIGECLAKLSIYNTQNGMVEIISQQILRLGKTCLSMIKIITSVFSFHCSFFEHICHCVNSNSVIILKILCVSFLINTAAILYEIICECSLNHVISSFFKQDCIQFNNCNIILKI